MTTLNHRPYGLDYRLYYSLISVRHGALLTSLILQSLVICLVQQTLRIYKYTYSHAYPSLRVYGQLTTRLTGIPRIPFQSATSPIPPLKVISCTVIRH